MSNISGYEKCLWLARGASSDPDLVARWYVIPSLHHSYLRWEDVADSVSRSSLDGIGSGGSGPSLAHSRVAATRTSGQVYMWVPTSVFLVSPLRLVCGHHRPHPLQRSAPRRNVQSLSRGLLFWGGGNGRDPLTSCYLLLICDRQLEARHREHFIRLISGHAASPKQTIGGHPA